jgi:predicted nucleotide-binding protein (sugar kinase/HSP70/actin superfamily)
MTETDLTVEQIERIIANHKSGVQIASVHLYRQLLAAMREVTMLREMNERNVEQAWKSMEDMKADVERLRAYIESWIMILDPEPGTIVNVQIMQDEARKALAASEAG